MLNWENLPERETCLANALYCGKRTASSSRTYEWSDISYIETTLLTCARLFKHIPNACSRNLHYSVPFCVVVFSLTSSIEKFFLLGLANVYNFWLFSVFLTETISVRWLLCQYTDFLFDFVFFSIKLTICLNPFT